MASDGGRRLSAHRHFTVTGAREPLAPANDEGGGVRSDPVSSLDREWRELAGGVLPARLRVWAQREPALSAFREPVRLIRFLRSSASAAAKDELLRALVRIA